MILNVSIHLNKAMTLLITSMLSVCFLSTNSLKAQSKAYSVLFHPVSSKHIASTVPLEDVSSIPELAKKGFFEGVKDLPEIMLLDIDDVSVRSKWSQKKALRVGECRRKTCFSVFPKLIELHISEGRVKARVSVLVSKSKNHAIGGTLTASATVSSDDYSIEKMAEDAIFHAMKSAGKRLTRRLHVFGQF